MCLEESIGCFQASSSLEGPHFKPESQSYVTKLQPKLIHYSIFPTIFH